MAREQVLYKLLKLSSAFICENNLNIEDYTLRQAYLDGNLVSAGDNIAFTQIRYIRGDYRDYHKIFHDAMDLQNNIRMLRKQGEAKIAQAFQQKLFRELFVQDVICVQSGSKGEYRRLAKNGFCVNGKRYFRGSASAGQIRHNCVYFFSEDVYDELYKRLMCDLDNRIDKMVLAKLSAYFSLSTSSVLWVSTPRVCVIDDFFTTLKNQDIDWITNDSAEKRVVVQKMDIEMNSCDGQGLISPDMAAQWSREMGLDYVSSSYVTRMIFTKGNLVPFDFRGYAHEHGCSTIKDYWGVEHNVNDIDVILSISQFKMYKYYKSWEDFKKYTDKYDIRWGVSRYSPKYDSEYVLANYQIIQVLNINKDEVKELVQPTVDWIQRVCQGDELYSMLYCLGGFTEDYTMTYQDVISRAQSTAMKAVVKNPDFLKDTYIQRRIYRNIVEAINKAKTGKIWVRGNYSFMISDPIAQCRSALGLDPTGEIPGEYIYSNFWNGRKEEGEEIVLCRSPLLDKHEINYCKLYRSDIADKWYKWIQSGVIYSIYDLSTLRHSDSDYDGDLVMSSDDRILRKGSMKDSTNPITYHKEKAVEMKITRDNLIKTDILGFGTKIGSYSNISTNIEAMRPLYEAGSKEDEELLERKKKLREVNGQEIDRIKGIKAIGPPKDEWFKFEKINPDDDEETKQKKIFHNKLLIKKKPYFFRYRYKDTDKKYTEYEKAYNKQSSMMFGMGIKKLIAKKNKTPLEREFVRRWFKYCPVQTTDCIMNVLCRQVENVNFDINYNRNCVSMLPYRDLNTFDIDEDILKRIKEIRTFYNQEIAEELKMDVTNKEDSEEDIDEDIMNVKDAIHDKCKMLLDELNLDTLTILTYIKIIANQQSKFDWSFAWRVLGDDILEVIEKKTCIAPVESEDGTEYLGRKYKLSEIPDMVRDNIMEEINDGTL